jgi:uncharacterized protein (TIGR01777 family)
MRIALTGATGFIGSGLRKTLERNHYEVLPVSRQDFDSPVLKEKLECCEGVIHVAGESIGGIWTPAKRKRIFESRVNTTRKLVETIIELKDPVSFFISISGVGIYDTDHVQMERSAWFADDFLAHVIREWEGQANRLLLENVRVVIVRSGVILSNRGGILKLLVTPFNLGLSYGIRSFHNFPVIHYLDLQRIFLWILEHNQGNGVYNAVLPEFVSIHDFFGLIRERKRTRIHLLFPPWFLRMVMGESSSLLTNGQWVVPQRLLEEGFSFDFPNVRNAIADCI